MLYYAKQYLFNRILLKVLRWGSIKTVSNIITVCLMFCKEMLQYYPYHFSSEVSSFLPSLYNKSGKMSQKPCVSCISRCLQTSQLATALNLRRRLFPHGVGKPQAFGIILSQPLIIQAESKAIFQTWCCFKDGKCISCFRFNCKIFCFFPVERGVRLKNV